MEALASTETHIVTIRPRTPEERFDALPEGARAELIRGKIVMMGSPTGEHQDAAGAIYAQLWQYLRGKRCHVYSEFDVKPNTKRQNIYRPDVTVLCDPSKYTSARIIGAPDMVVEVLSPSSVGNDAITKRASYEEAGIPEYWIVNIIERVVHVLLLVNGKYEPTTYKATDSIKLTVLDDCVIDLTYVFPPEPVVVDVEDEE
ncbi:hypothetical protein FACS1894184_00980 [Clostridia bacterium]|nr:hypothetical protein FACS1894184_00980 [Clostridia bacterium]